MCIDVTLILTAGASLTVRTGFRRAGGGCMRHNRALTLIEILIVIVLLGVLVTFTLPRLTQQGESVILSEAVTAAGTVYHGQKIYLLDTGSYATNCASLDAVVRLTQFQAPVCNSVDPVVQICRTGGAYCVNVRANGTYYCSGTCANITRYLPQ
jgi:prepilin-type N-terminal cleavage/methylation domain-containing protein